MSALVTTIIPVFNGARFIREAIESVLAQTWQPIELIVVDDGSTDGTAAIVQQIPGVRYAHQVNRRAGAARNHGVRLAGGQFIALLDADDIWLPEKIERQLALFRERPEVSSVVTSVRHFFEHEVRGEEAHYQRLEKMERAGFAGSTVLFRRALFETIGSFDEQLVHNSLPDWFDRARRANAVMATLDVSLVRRRMHGANVSRDDAGKRDEFLMLAKRSLDRARAAKQRSLAAPE